jgi:hypothetical protein
MISWGQTTLSRICLPFIKVVWFGEISFSLTTLNLLVTHLEKDFKDTVGQSNRPYFLRKSWLESLTELVGSSLIKVPNHHTCHEQAVVSFFYLRFAVLISYLQIISHDVFLPGVVFSMRGTIS